jgi:DNA repair protein RecO (recombination protein O)
LDRTRVYRVSAVVIRQRDLGEADRIVTLFTRDRGKVSAVAKGVKRPRSKFAGALQLFSHLSILLAAGRTLEVVTQVQPIDLFYHLRDDMGRYSHACYAAELLGVFTEEGAAEPDLFDLLVGVLKGLDGGGDPATLIRGYELKLLSRLGYGPELAACVSCAIEVEGGQAGFAVAEGGVQCRRCARALGVMEISASALRAMRELLAMPVEQMATRRLSRAAREELERILRPFVDYHVPRPVRCAAFLS